MRTTIAIDPGNKGGIAVMDAAGVRVAPFKGTLNPLREAVRECQNQCRVVIEAQVGSGRRSDQSYGRHLGRIDEIVRKVTECFDIRPQVWQRPFLRGYDFETKQARKSHLLAVAKRRYPDLDGVTLDTCDALLILAFWLERERRASTS